MTAGRPARLVPVPALFILLLVGACAPVASPTPSGSASVATPDATRAAAATPVSSADPSASNSPSPLPSLSGGPRASASVSPSADASASAPASVAPSVAPSRAPSVAPTLPPPAAPAVVAHDPRKFGFAAKGMTNEVLAFVTRDQIDYAVESMDWDVVSTVAYFSLTATGEGSIERNDAWRAWNSAAMSRLIEKAHANGTKVVISLERFSWSPAQSAVSAAALSTGERRGRLAREIAAEVVRRAVDGVNVDFEPIPPGQKEEFTHFIRTLRRELDRVRPGSQLTFCVIGHHDTYDVAGATGPDGADAVYLMGYHYAGTWSEAANSTAPMGGPRYDVVDTVVSLLDQVERHELIVGVPYYGHVWPTAGSGRNAGTDGEGFDVPLHRAIDLADRHGLNYDETEQVAWVPYRSQPCAGCPSRWFQLYFDDARASGHKWAWIKRNKLLGTGIWTIGFEGAPGPHDEVLRGVFLAR